MAKLGLGTMLSIVGIGAALCACNADIEETPAYDLAQSCIAIRAADDQSFLTVAQADTFRFSAAQLNDQRVAKFFVKPSGLGHFLLYNRQGQYLSATRHGLQSRAEPSTDAEWLINEATVRDDDQQVLGTSYALKSKSRKRYLQAADGQPKLARFNPDKEPASFAFDIVKTPGDCRDFPEAPLNADVSERFHKVRSDGDEVRGFIDYHTHIGFPMALGSVAMSGHVFHPYGIEHALGSCEGIHGENGTFDFLEGQNTDSGAGGHATAGYPDFEYWPNRRTNTHVQAYYRWLERAYLSGLRMLVTNVTGNPTFCQLLSILHPKEKQGQCNSDDAVRLQTEAIYELQDYIDAQEGGPGKGWLKVVTSPTEARQVISRNKLAVVLGVEHGSLFDCSENAANCTQDYIDRKLDELYEMGVRSVFPIHRFDNAFGGTRPQGGSGGAWMHLTSKISTSHINHLTDLVNPAKLLFKPIEGHFWELEPCPAGVAGTRGVKSMQQFVDEDFRFLVDTVKSVPVVGSFAAKLLNWTFIDKLRPLPTYDEFADGQGACNRRPLQETGRYLVNGVIDRGMILEVDHMSYPTLLDTLDILEARNYSGVVSSHGWIENRREIRERIFRLGGLMAPFNRRPSSVHGALQQYAAEMEQSFGIAGVGLATDIQGVTSQAAADPDVEVDYPFSSIDGTVTFYPPKTGNRQFSYATEGVAHYGLLPEWIENLRQVDEREGTNSIDILMRSAEAYLQMWERAEAQAGR